MNMNNFVFLDVKNCRLIKRFPGVSKDYNYFTFRLKQNCLSVTSRRVESSINNVLLSPWEIVTVRVVTVIANRQLTESRSQSPHGLRRRSAAARLLRLWVRIQPGHGCFSAVTVVCCQVEVSATNWSLVQRSPTDYDASLCVIKKPQEWGDHGSQRHLKKTEKLGVDTNLYSTFGWTYFVVLRICSRQIP